MHHIVVLISDLNRLILDYQIKKVACTIRVPFDGLKKKQKLTEKGDSFLDEGRCRCRYPGLWKGHPWTRRRRYPTNNVVRPKACNQLSIQTFHWSVLTISFFLKFEPVGNLNVMMKSAVIARHYCGDFVGAIRDNHLKREKNTMTTVEACK